MLYGLVDGSGAVLRFHEFAGAPPELAATKGLRWLPVSDTRPEPEPGQVLVGPEVTVTDNSVCRVWHTRPLTHDERLSACHVARRAGYPPIGDQLDALARALSALADGGLALPAETLAWLGDVAAVKQAHPKPPPPGE